MVMIAGFHGGSPVIVRAAEPTSGVKVVPAEVTTDAKGNLTVIFATLNVIDSDGDVTLPGAFPAKEVPLSAWGHAVWQPGFLPVGRGRISEERGKAIFRGRVFLTTIAGRETFEVLRGLGPLVEFSYGFNILESDRGSFGGTMVRFLKKLDVHEVSPVLRGAGLGTGVIEMSSVDPVQIDLANAAAANDREILRLRGFTAAQRKRIGHAPDGAPVFVGAIAGRKA